MSKPVQPEDPAPEVVTKELDNFTGAERITQILEKGQTSDSDTEALLTIDEALNLRVSFGKYKGQTYEQLLLLGQIGQRYIKWISEWENAREEQAVAAEVILAQVKKSKKALRSKQRNSRLKDNSKGKATKRGSTLN